jgi:hypothetical protein
MSLRITSRALCALSTHARNLGKVAEVLGALKAKPSAGDVDVAVEHKDGARLLTFKANGNGSSMVLPLMGLDASGIDGAALSLLVGLEAMAKASNPARTDSAELASLRAELERATACARNNANDATHKAGELLTLRADLKEAKATLSTINPDASRAALCALRDERDNLLATVEDLTSALARATSKPLAAVAPIKARLDAAKADHGSLVDACIAETVAQAAPKAKPAPAVVAPVAAPVVAAVAVAAAAAVETLQELEGRADVELESMGSRVVRVTFLPIGGLRGRQGSGVADALKARGFRYDAKASAGGRLVWVR